MSIKSSDGGEPVVLCGSKLPQPMEFPGGNITVTHHFLPHLFPVSSFLLNYARGIAVRLCVSWSFVFFPLTFSPVPPPLDSGECPVTSFECLGGRCLPNSWRCNGQVECLGEGAGQGSDEQGCDADVAATEATKSAITLEEESKSGRQTEENRDENLEKHVTLDKTPQRDESKLWALLKEKAEEDAQVDEEQPQAHRELAVTPAPIEWPCGGLLQTFYGTFSPPALRGPAMFCVWTLDPQDSRPLRLDLQQLVLGPGDRLTVYNRQQGKGDVLKIVRF